MSNLSTLPKGDSAWLLRKAIERIMEQVSVLETNIGSSTTGNSANTQIIFNDNGTLRGDAGLVYNKTTDALTAGNATITGDLTVDTSTLKVDSTNDAVGIGTTSPTTYGAKLAVFGSGNGIIAVGNATSYTTLQSNGNDFYLNMKGVGSTIFRLGSGDTESMRLNPTGNVVLKGGTIGADGVGVTFPATPVASSDANCLDDYEEGTFTPTIIGATTAGVGVYTTQAGYYTKVGNLVTASVFLGWTAHTGTGNMYFAGLPFAASSSASYHGAASISYVNNIALTASNVLTLFISGGASSLEASQYPVGGGGATNVPVDVSGNIIYTVTYRV